MPCEECHELRTHRFRSSADLVNALQVAAGEVDRGVLALVATRSHSPAEEEALRSALKSGAMSSKVAHRFKCNICGDGFELLADANLGTGEWKRNGEVV